MNVWQFYLGSPRAKPRVHLFSYYLYTVLEQASFKLGMTPHPHSLSAFRQVGGAS